MGNKSVSIAGLWSPLSPMMPAPAPGAWPYGKGPGTAETSSSFRGANAFPVWRQGRRGSALDAAPGIYAALGPSELPSWFLSALCPVLAHTGVFWIDAGNCFDAYGAGYASRALGFDPRRLMSRVRLARPFNLFQLETIVREKLPALWRGEPVVLSDPLSLLYEEDLPEESARRVGANILEGMASLPAVWMVLAVERKAPGARVSWLEELSRRASGLVSLRSAGGRWLLESRS